MSLSKHLANVKHFAVPSIGARSGPIGPSKGCRFCQNSEKLPSKTTKLRSKFKSLSTNVVCEHVAVEVSGMRTSAPWTRQTVTKPNCLGTEQTHQ